MRRYHLHTAAMALDSSGTLQLFPDRPFAPLDGRPEMVLSAENAKKMVQAFERRRGTELAVDYEHQLIHAQKNGQPAPAAGWITALRYEPGVGVLASVRWTERAKSLIDAGEYRYASPVFATHSNDSNILPLVFPPAITNNPAIPGMAGIDELIAASAIFNDEETTMDMAKLRALLGLPETATEADIEEALKALIGAKQQAASMVPLSAVQQLQGELAQVKGALLEQERARLIEQASADGKLPASMRTWAASQTPEALRAYIQHAPAIPALTGLQTAGMEVPNGGATLTADEMFVARKLRLTPEQMQGAK